MIIYRNSVSDFRNEVDQNIIVEQIEKQYHKLIGRRVGTSERRAWNNSLQFMERVVRRSNIPDDCGVLIEYNIPSTSKRIDFVLTGHDENNQSNFVIVELKQWEEAESSTKDALVRTYLGQGIRDVPHPSYQASSYKKYMTDMNAAIYEGGIRASSCAYLHNYTKQEPEPLLQEQYRELVEESPIFFRSDTEKLQAFLNKYVGKGKGLGILFEIENGRIAPSRKFIEFVSELFEGNEIFTLLDEQKVALSSILDIALNAKEKTCIIINGGPGTGKSVVAMNAFARLLENKLNLQFIAPNAAFRETLLEYLSRGSKYSKTRLKALFSGSGSFYDAKNNEFDVLICDEAHRLKKKGTYMYKGVSQVRDLIHAAKVSVFFVDDYQMIRPDDEGSIARINEVADELSVKVETVHLEAQFRCSGAEGFINWVDHTLQIRDTANFNGWDKESFEFEIMDNPHALWAKIEEKDRESYNARLLAGYAWPWTSEKDGNSDAQIADIVIEEHDFAMPWNSRSQVNTWATDPNKKDQIGCIHTSQGLEFDYVGVIIGNDLRYDRESGTLYASASDYYDRSGKKGISKDPEALVVMIKNIYKVLMSRGMKGCFIYCTDPDVQQYFKERLKYSNPS